MLPILAPIALPVAAAWAITRFHLNGADLSRYDDPDIPITFNPKTPSKGNADVAAYLHEKFIKPAQDNGTPLEQLQAKRERFEQNGLNREFDAAFRQDTAAFGGVSVDGEWTLVEGANPNRRLLYLHGGGGTVGSAVSHRPIISNIAKRTGCVVFAANYRLLPENSRREGMEDCWAAYQWLLNNGPDGPALAEKVAIGGDSAGANLTLCMLNWIKAHNIRKPDAAFTISAPVDSTMTSPSIRKNYETDIMLQPLAAPVLKIPRALALWGLWRMGKMSPASPDASPIFADLSGLPPLLMHVSAAEMLYDDTRRYTNKARSQGSDVTMQSWAHVCHVWHAFDLMIPEARHALDEIGAFLKAHGVAA